MGFKELFIEFSKEKTKTIKRNVGYNQVYDNIVMKKMPQEIEGQLKNTDIIIKRSVGMTQYAHIPWICLMSSNPRIARSAQKGIYVVILFTKDGSSFYLALSQGYTHFKEMAVTPKQRDDLMLETLKYFQNEIRYSNLSQYGFTKNPIDLGQNVTALGKGYVQTTILSKKYDVESFDEKDFYNSLEILLQEYDDIIMHFEGKSYDEVIDIITNQTNFESLDVALENIEKDIRDNFVEYRDMSHKPIEVTKGERRSNRFSKIRQNVIRKKADYLKLARENFQTGTLGEKIALKIERERVSQLGLDPDRYITRVSIESDSFGYDIESIDIQNNELVKIYIEVKATKDITDSAFFVSKNELEISKQKGNAYRILRIFDITSIIPKYYIAIGKIEDNFYLDPTTYRAIYKFEVTT